MMAQANWDTKDIPDLGGKTAVVTGANSGLGWHTTAALAGKGAHVVMACRDEARTRNAMAEIVALHPHASLEFQRLDLADLSSVAAFAAPEKIDLLINNAGVMFSPRGKTVDGFETHFGTNHLGHFALTLRLLPRLRGGRVVTVASEFARLGRIDLDDLNAERKFSRVWAYANAKLANLMFALELDRRAQDVTSIAAHPGYSATNLQTAGVRMGRPDALARFGDWAMKHGNRLFAQSAAMGALPSLMAATAPGVKGGDYYGPRDMAGARGYPDHAPKPRQALDKAVAAKLWALSEDMTGVSI
jgi:NAD(P)-dependent dehydrogenase (short-subunit alcohol dehydrogenase family)